VAALILAAIFPSFFCEYLKKLLPLVVAGIGLAFTAAAAPPKPKKPVVVDPAAVYQASVA